MDESPRRDKLLDEDSAVLLRDDCRAVDMYC